VASGRDVRGSALVAALDVGTSSVRALVFDGRGVPVPGVEAHLPYRPRVSREGAAEVDAEDLFRLATAALDRVLRLAGRRRAARLRAVGVSTFWHGLLGAGADGEPLTPLFLWSDTRSWMQAEELKRQLDPEAVRQRTGCPLHSSYWPAKLAWLRREHPHAWRRCRKWLSFGDLLYWRLFGEPGTSLSMASGTGLANLAAPGWDGELLDALELDEERLPALREAASGLRPEFRRRWPQLAEVPWLHAAGDGALANLGSACLDPSQRSLTVGTSGALRAMTERRPGAIPAGLWCCRLDRRRFVVGGALSNGGNLYAWLVRTLAVDGERLERQVARMRPAAHGLTFLPLLAGERSLGYAARATGAVAGLTQATTAAQLVRAGLEAVALDFALVDRRLDEALPPPRRLVASGGGLLRSPAWMRIMADAIGRPVVASRAAEASSRGAAVLALEHLGEARAAARRPLLGRTYRPHPDAAPAYRGAMERQQALYQALVRDGLLDRDRAGAPAHLQPRR
jgi:gluconokinase